MAISVSTGISIELHLATHLGMLMLYTQLSALRALPSCPLRDFGRPVAAMRGGDDGSTVMVMRGLARSFAAAPDAPGDATMRGSIQVLRPGSLLLAFALGVSSPVLASGVSHSRFSFSTPDVSLWLALMVIALAPIVLLLTLVALTMALKHLCSSPRRGFIRSHGTVTGLSLSLILMVIAFGTISASTGVIAYLFAGDFRIARLSSPHEGLRSLATRPCTTAAAFTVHLITHVDVRLLWCGAYCAEQVFSSFRLSIAALVFVDIVRHPAVSLGSVRRQFDSARSLASTPTAGSSRKGALVIGALLLLCFPGVAASPTVGGWPLGKLLMLDWSWFEPVSLHGGAALYYIQRLRCTETRFMRSMHWGHQMMTLCMR